MTGQAAPAVTMLALTVLQPWAWAIAHDDKRVENRRWSTSHRGPLAIHAGVRLDTDLLRATPAHLLPPRDQLVLGAVIAVAELHDVCARSVGRRSVRCSCGPWADPDSYHWRLRDVRLLATPHPVRGWQRLWTVHLPELVMRGLAVAPSTGTTSRKELAR